MAAYQASMTSLIPLRGRIHANRPMAKFVRRRAYATARKKSIEHVLSAQDPQKRISYLPQRIGYEAVIQQFGSDVDLETARQSAYLLPFWTMVFLTDVKRGLKHQTEGWVENGKPRKSLADIGCSIAAVGKDHWAFGLVLMDDIRELAQMIQADNRKAALPSGTANIYDQTQIGWGGVEKKKWDPIRTPIFAFGPPNLTFPERKRISEIPGHKSGMLVETWAAAGNPMIFAVPTYRVGYKVDLAGGKTGYVDGYFDQPSHRIVLSRRENWLSTNLSWTSSQSIRYNARKLFQGFHTTSISSEPLLPAYKSAEVSEMLVWSMRSSKNDWSAQSIIPWSGDERSGYMLQKQLDERIFGRVDVEERMAKPVKSKVTLPRTSRARSMYDRLKGQSLPTSTPKSSRPPPEDIIIQPPPPLWSAYDTPPAAQRLFSPPSQEKPPVPPPPPASFPFRQKPHTNNHASPPNPRLNPTLSTSIPSPLLPQVKPVPAIPDPRGFYALLGIVPTKDFIDPTRARVITRKLSDQRKVLALKHHSDRGGWDNVMARINVAYDHVSSYERRQKYYSMNH